MGNKSAWLGTSALEGVVAKCQNHDDMLIQSTHAHNLNCTSQCPYSFLTNLIGSQCQSGSKTYELSRNHTKYIVLRSRTSLADPAICSV